MKPAEQPIWYETLNKAQAREIYTKNIDLQDETYDRIEEIKAEIDAAYESKSLINLYFHRTLARNPENNYHCKVEYLHEIVDCLHEKGFCFMTYKELNDALLEIQE